MIVCIGSGFAEPESGLYSCFASSAYSFGNCEEMNRKIGCVVVLIKSTFDLVVVNSRLIWFISTVIHLQ